MAELLKRELGVEATLITGRKGEFTVLVDGQTIAKKRWYGLPSGGKVISSVRAALSS